MTRTDVRIIEVPGPLEDLATFLDDIPVGKIEEFSIDADPDEDLLEGGEREIEHETKLSDLEALTVWYILRDQLGGDWWTYESRAIVDVLGDTFGIAPADADLIRSLQLLEAGNAFWKEWEVFNWITQGIKGDGTDFTNFPVPDPMEMYESMLVAAAIGTSEGRKETYGTEVLSYIAACCVEEGLWALPWPLVVAQDRVNELLKMRALSLPIDRIQEATKGKERPTDSPLAIQWEKCQVLRDTGREVLKETAREMSTYRRVK